MKKIIGYLTFTFLTCITLSGKVSAAPINLYANRNSVSVGDTVVITAKTNDAMGSYTISSSNSGVLSGGTSGVFQTPNEQVTTSFTAKAVGKATITFKPSNMALVSNEQLYTTPSSVTITVGNKTSTTTNTPAKDLSSENTLSSLSIDGIELSPVFNKNTTSYTVSLEPDITKINVKATSTDKNAHVTGIGEIEVKEGNNDIEIVVTAEDGSTKTYTIKVNIKEYDPINVKINGKKYTIVRNRKDIEVPIGYKEITIKINGEEIPAYKSKKTGYTLVALRDSKGKQNLYIYINGEYILYKEYTFNKIILYPMELKKIPKEYKKTTITFNGEKIVAYKKDKVSNYALMYGMNVETGKKHIYMYDEEEGTLQIYNAESDKKMEEYKLLIAGLSGFVTLIFLILIITIIKNHKYNKQQKIVRKQMKKQNKQVKKEKSKIDDNNMDMSDLV